MTITLSDLQNVLFLFFDKRIQFSIGTLYQNPTSDRDKFLYYMRTGAGRDVEIKIYVDIDRFVMKVSSDSSLSYPVHEPYEYKSLAVLLERLRFQLIRFFMIAPSKNE